MTKRIGRALAIALATPAAVLSVQACTGDLAPTTVDGANLDASTDGNTCAPYVVEPDAGDLGAGCTGVIQRLPCGIPSGTTLYGDCYFNLHDCNTLCSGQSLSCRYHGDCEAGVAGVEDALVECATSCPPVTGRRPERLVPAEKQMRSTRIGEMFAEAAHLEAASVHAFRILKRELAELGAPEGILRAAERARRDEIRHTRTTARLAKLHGGKPARARVRKERARSLEEIAIENVVEGCVRETFGALIAKHQAERAEDETIARAMREIADDEARHAALAWSVAAWAAAKLDAAANARVEAARAKAIRDLEAETSREPHSVLVTRAGLPSLATQKAMLAALFAT